MSKYLLSTMMIALLASCTKQVESVRADVAASVAVRSDLATGLRQGTNRFSATSPTTAIQIFQGVDPMVLQAALNSGNNTLNPLFAGLASQVRSYFENVHQVDFEEEELNLTNAEMVIMGMVFAGIEMGDFNDESSLMSSVPGDFEFSTSIGGESCFYAVLGSFFAVRDIVSLVQQFRSGAVSASTIIRTVKVMMGRVATVFAVGLAVYSLGDCLGWWS